MRTILYLIRKEFLQIFRDKFIGKAIFAVPLVQMVLLVPAVTFEIKNINLGIIDRDMSPVSRNLISRLEGSGFFKITCFTHSEEEANNMLHRNRCDMILHIPEGLDEKTTSGQVCPVMVSVNAINATTAQLSWAYLNGVLQDYNIDIIRQNAAVTTLSAMPQIKVTNRYWYNELLNYKYYMLPGILAILVTAIGFLLAGLNLVKEKETGTIEQINVTPIKKYQFITAKMIPFMIIGLVDLALGLILGKILFDIPFRGSIGLMFLCSAIFLAGVLGLALFISTFSSTQQQYMFIAFFFMIIFILMSGIFTPMDSMPLWARKFDIINPMAYLMKIYRMIMLKGSAFSDIARDFYSLLILAVVFMSLAVRKYRKTA